MDCTNEHLVQGSMFAIECDIIYEIHDRQIMIIYQRPRKMFQDHHKYNGFICSEKGVTGL